MQSVEKRYMGVDLGTSGGFVVLNSDGTVIDVFKMPENRQDFIDKLSKYSICKIFCIAEKTYSTPINGSKASYTFGKIVERALFSLEVCKIPYQEVTPQTWMKTFMLKREKKESHVDWKNRLKAKAQQLFPKEKITLWNSDAFLLALFCYRNYK